MKRTTVESKLKAAVERVRASWKRNGVPNYTSPTEIARITKGDFSRILAMPYSKRAGVFSIRNCSFNPVSGEADSYSWYVLATRIKGVQILNTYTYSNSTAKHTSKVSSVMDALGIKYIELDAPKGLQDLQRAKEHILFKLASEVLANQYARIKSNTQVKYFEKQIKLLERLGIRITKREREGAKVAALTARTVRLEQQRADRKQRAEISATLESPVKRTLRLLADANIEADVASPNFVADFASNRGVSLESAEVVEVSNAYEGRKS